MTTVRIIPRNEAEGLPDLLDGAIDPVLRRVYLNRGVTSQRELSYGLETLPPPGGLSGTGRAAELLYRVMKRNGRICILADFDADGATSCALAVRALRGMGAARVDYLVPNRFAFGYGLTPEIAAVVLERSPDLVITVDNGISSIRGAAAIRRAGVALLITDHHLPGPELPEADAIVNPNLPGEGFAAKNLAGVGVIFYVMAALRERLRREGWFENRCIPVPKLAELLDLVALGTVADVVPLDQYNRTLVFQGVERIRAGRCCPGIRSLLEVSGRDPARLVTADFGFAAGPRLNAAGMLDDMSFGIECLLTDDSMTAYAMARELDGLNRERRRIEQEMKEQAIRHLDDWMPEGEVPAGFCIYHPQWHQGVIGILASRIRERYHRPVIAFAPSEEEGMLKGSARSIPGFHIRDALDGIAASRPELLEKFGGHAMAAGLSLRAGNLEAFRAAFAAEVERRVDPLRLQGAILSDGALEPDRLTLELAERLREGGPWGEGFPEPRFDNRFRVVGHRLVGDHHLKLVLQSPGNHRMLDAIAFHQHERAGLLKSAELIHAAYKLDVNEYRGTRNLQLIVDYFTPA